MQPNGYPGYPYPTGPANPQMQVRYMVPPSAYRQTSPPFANQAFDRYGMMPGTVRPNSNMMQPMRYPQGTRPGYLPSGVPATPGMPPIGMPPRLPVSQQQSRSADQLQPPQPYYFNPNGLNPPPKKGAKEFKENAFTIAPDGAHSEAIKGLVSNNDINDLLKHKGTRVKVSKIYRITKTKPEAVAASSSDEELPAPYQKPPSQSQPTPYQKPPSQPQAQQQPPPPPASVQRPDSSSSSNSHCSTCSNCSCTDCRARERTRSYDDCPECRAEREREQARRRRRR